MKFDLLKNKAAIFVIGSILGLTIGFKIANIQLRNEQGLIKRNAVVEAAGQISQSTNTGNDPRLTKEQRDQINNQVRAASEKAKANPEDFDAQLDAATQYIQINQPQDAFPFLEQARKTRPNDSRALAAFAFAKMYMGQFDEGIKVAKQARDQDPKNPMLGMILFMGYVETRTNLGEADQLLRELEAGGIDPQRLAQMRKDLEAARAGGAGNETAPASGSTIDHGTRTQKPGGSR